MSQDERRHTSDPTERADAWRATLGLTSPNEAGAALESAHAGDGTPTERIRQAREEMRRHVLDRLGGDPALLSAVDEIALSGRDAAAILADASSTPDVKQFDALEAVVAFDGTRPSFLIRDGEIDFSSSLDTRGWRTTLAPYQGQLSDVAACVGRIERGLAHIGTAFLVSPTLAITNRHVAQSIADLDAVAHPLSAPTFMDFGREQGGRRTCDRREVLAVLFAGDRAIGSYVDHTKLDLALLKVSESVAEGGSERRLAIGPALGAPGGRRLVAALGYPSDWRRFTPADLQTEFGEVLARLLDGDAGMKRFSPGEFQGMAPEAPARTAMHDATTINGNSGSPMLVLRPGASLPVSGLHYAGRWSGARTNWAHVLASCGDDPCTGGKPLRDALADHGVQLG